MELCIALPLLVLGLVLGIGIGGISFGAGYDRIGPRFFPHVIAFGLLALGSFFLMAAFTRRGTAAAMPGQTSNWAPMLYLASSLLLTLLLLERVGFVIACAIQFWLVARAFGSRRPVRDAVVGCGLALLCFLAFSNGLGLTLPLGIFEGIL